MTDKDPSKGGRPTKYDPKYCDEIIDHMARGFSFESFAGKLRISQKTLYNWAEAHDEFLQAKHIGFECSRHFWEDVGIKGANGDVPNFNATSFVFNMKNRFPNDWRDKQELTGSLTLEPSQKFVLGLFKMTPEQREARLKQIKDRDAEFEESQKLFEGSDEPDT